VNVLSKISIIVPIYNTDKFLEDCIKSLINQSYSNIEIILINDGSTDNSLSICEKYKQIDSRIIVKSIENSGVSIARNIGLNMVTGDYVTFVDSDDWIEPHTIKLALNNISEEDAEIAIWSYFKNYEHKEVELSLVPGESRRFCNDSDKEILYLKSIYAHYNRTTKTEDVPVGTVMCKLYKVDFIRKNNLKFNPKLIRSEDVIFAINAFKLANKIIYFDESLYHYRINSNSMSFGFKYISDTETPFNLLVDELNKFKILMNNNKLIQEVIYCRIIQIISWHFSYNYFNMENQNNIFKKRTEMKKLIKQENYASALSKVKLNNLTKQRRVMVWMLRRDMILSFYFFQKALKVKKSITKR